MAHAQKPDFVYRRNGWVHLNRWERQFSRLLAAEVCASVVVMLYTPCSEVVWRVLATHSIRQFLLHFPPVRRRMPQHFNWSLQFHAFLTLALNEACGQRFVSGRKKRGTHLTGNHVRSIHYQDSDLERNLSLLPYVRSRADNLRLRKCVRNTCTLDSDIRVVREQWSVTTCCAKKLSSSSSLR